jgi:flagellar biosynthesis component FlhA
MAEEMDQLQLLTRNMVKKFEDIHNRSSRQRSEDRKSRIRSTNATFSIKGVHSFLLFLFFLPLLFFVLDIALFLSVLLSLCYNI